MPVDTTPDDPAAFHRKRNGVCLNCALKAFLGELFPDGADHADQVELAVALAELRGFALAESAPESVESWVKAFHAYRAHHGRTSDAAGQVLH